MQMKSVPGIDEQPRENYVLRRESIQYIETVFDLSRPYCPEIGKIEQVRLRAIECIPDFKAFVYSLVLALGMHNVYRFPREVYHYGGLPFMIAHFFITFLISMPIVFLKIGLGQFCERGVLKLWRAVPAFRGVGYAQLMMAYLCVACNAISMALSGALMVRIAKGPVPFPDCPGIFIDEVEEYGVNSTTGLQCLRKAMLSPVLEDPTSFGINASFVFCLWLLTAACLYKKVKSFRVSLVILGVAIFACGLTLSIFTGISPELRFLFTDSDWRMLLNHSTWHAALIQSFLALHIGLGYHAAASSTIYRDRNSLRISAELALTSVLVSWLSVLFWYKHRDGREHSIIDMLVAVYENAAQAIGPAVGPCAALILYMLSGVVTNLALLFPIYNSIWVDITCTWKIFTIASMSIVLGVILSLTSLFQGIGIAALMDDYVMPALLTFTVTLDVFAFTFIFAYKKVYSVMEFLLGRVINSAWKLLWGATPFLILGLTIWRVWGYLLTSTRQLEVWEWWFVLDVILFHMTIIITTELWVVLHQVEYNIFKKIALSFKPSHKWGPDDPIRRYGWLQWNSSESKDFTLKRKGTVDYTNSVRVAGNNVRRVPRRRNKNEVMQAENVKRCANIAHQKTPNIYTLEVNNAPVYETAIILPRKGNNNFVACPTPNLGTFHEYEIPKMMNHIEATTKF